MTYFYFLVLVDLASIHEPLQHKTHSSVLERNVQACLMYDYRNIIRKTRGMIMADGLFKGRPEAFSLSSPWGDWNFLLDECL